MLILQWRGQLSLHAERSELSQGKILFQRATPNIPNYMHSFYSRFTLHTLRQPNLI